MEEDPWDAFARVTSTSSESGEAKADSGRSQRLARLARDYYEATHHYDAAKTLKDSLAEEIIRLFPEEPGQTVEVVDDEFILTVSRNERFIWDKEALQELVSTGEIPDYVRVSYTVDKRKFDKLPEKEKAPLEKHLTRALTSPKLEIDLV